ncbi:MAG: MbnH family di-heme enzyme [Myxococcota bacterium]
MRLRLAPFAIFIAACVPGGGETQSALRVPPNFPAPRIPEDNPLTVAKVELGRHLFYDVRLSDNETQSCASCHRQEFAFTDGLPRGVGSTGEAHPRGSMSLANVAYSATLGWANPVLTRLEDQALVPMFGEEPVELGLRDQETLLARLRAEPRYDMLFSDAYPDEEAPTLGQVVDALGSFQRTLISGNSAYDRYIAGERSAMSAEALRGLELFEGEDLECFHCHGGFNFSSSVDHAGNVFDQATFQNNGLYNVDGRGAYPPDNPGVAEFTNEFVDQGAFKPPTLRNIAVTAPYMHDGSLATLNDVIDMYAAGGQLTREGPNTGDGRTNPNKSIFVTGFTLTEEDRAALLAFLNSLTDERFLSDPRFSNPW